MTATPLPADPSSRLARARLALDGLSVGDAFGERFFLPANFHRLKLGRKLPVEPWFYTDDTVMALSITEVLERHGRIDQDDLAQALARRFQRDPWRGYGPAAHTMLGEIGTGTPWREAAARPFHGQGSMGNGSAMRIAPLGGYFADDLERVVEEARLSAAVTHAHPEGAAGAVAAAVAAALAWRVGQGQATAEDLWRAVLAHTPEGATREGLRRALEVLYSTPIPVAAAALGNGSRITCPDTVPFCVWCAARHLDRYPEALWNTVEAGGDIDTNCAIVGGIVALATGPDGIPPEWLATREKLQW